METHRIGGGGGYEWWSRPTNINCSALSKSQDTRRQCPASSSRPPPASLLLADSLLADAQLRYADPRGGHKKIPLEWRLCRFCMADVEDTLHALFECGGSVELVALRAALRAKCHSNRELRNALQTGLAPNEIFQRMIVSKNLAPILAEYAYTVIKVFETKAMFIAPEVYWFGQSVLEDKRNKALDVML